MTAIGCKSMSRDGRVRLFTMNGADWSKRYPRIVEEAARIKVNAVMDAEVVCLVKKGVADFDILNADHCVNASWLSANLYSAELYPTRLRAVGTGLRERVAGAGCVDWSVVGRLDRRRLRYPVRIRGVRSGRAHRWARYAAVRN